MPVHHLEDEIDYYIDIDGWTGQVVVAVIPGEATVDGLFELLIGSSVAELHNNVLFAIE